MTREGDGEAVTFPPRRIAVSCAVCAVYFHVCFCIFLSAKFPLFVKKVQEARIISMKDEPRGPHAVTQENEQERTFPFQADVDGSLHVNCTSPEQEGTTSFEANVGVKPEEKTSTAQKSPFARSLQNC